MSNENIARCIVDMEVRNGIPVKSTFKGDAEGFEIVAATLIHLIAKSRGVKTKEVFSDLINAVAFAENATPEMIEQLEKIAEELTNEQNQ